MNRKSYLAMAALVVGLLLGVIAGPSLRGVSVSAQTPSASPSAAPTNVGDTLRSLFLDKLAAALNIDRAALDSAIVAAGNGAADQAVQQGTLTQAQADALKARIQAGDSGALWGRHRGHGEHLGGADALGVKQAMLDATARALGITADELRTQLRSGQTLAQLAQAHNTTEQAVVNAALAAAKTRLDQAVAAGTLTQAQADAAYARLQARGSNLLFGGRGGGRHGRWQGSPAVPQASPSAAASPNA